MKRSARRLGILLLAWPWLAMAQGAPPAYGWQGPGPWHMWGGWGPGWIFPLLVLGGIVLCAVMLARGRSGRGRDGDTTTSALALLNERYAKGEISTEELEEKKAVLMRRP